MRFESFETPGRVRLDLRIPSGTISVDTDEVAVTEVELEATRDSEDLQTLIEGARIDARSFGDGIEVTVDVQRKRFRLLDFLGGDLMLRVRAPHDAEVEITTASADADLRGRFSGLKAELASGDLRAQEVNGRLDIKSASGDVELDVVGDDASVSTASGDIRLRRLHGEGTLRSASGDVMVDEAAESLTVQTASGDQRIGAVTAGRVVLQSASGDQLVGITRGSRVHLDVKTLSGDARSELELADEAPAGNGPMIELRATSMSGDITVVRA